MALAVDIMHGHGPSNEMHHQLQPRKTKVCKGILTVSIATKGFLNAVHYYITK